VSHVVCSMTLADKLKKWRETKGLSQEGAADYLGVPRGTLQGWEQGRHQANDLSVGAILRAINRYPITIEEKKKYNNKKIAFRDLRFGRALLSGSKGELWVSTNGEEGWAEVHVHQ
jgi:transcriptional regulator with XRE-family HTH domain